MVWALGERFHSCRVYLQHFPALRRYSADFVLVFRVQAFEGV